ncbi:MAG: acyl-CoA dehydrogenase [Actinobacteria bacterium 69-20]|nr:acyl-CoA dehydrogenase family protein [Actinomycetota bacterium]OJV24592.1 MAG: acyl-CoA dehydrogenase [Actinobacteria bacterium 69-20]
MAALSGQSPRLSTRLDLLAIDRTLSEDDLAIRGATRQLMDDAVRPYVADWYEAGEIPARDLARKCGETGLLGMHLEGYGCAGTSTVAYGLACIELEAADSGIRSLVSVQGSLAMFPIWKYGSEEQKQKYLPGMAAGEIVGCFGLTEPDAGSDPGSMRTRARRDGDSFVLDGSKMWITNGTVADIAVVWAKLASDDAADGTEGGASGRGAGEQIRGFIVPTNTPGFTAREVKHKLSLRASATAELTFDSVRLGPEAILPDARGLKAPLSCLTQARTGILFGALGAARDCLEVALDYVGTRTVFGSPLGSYQLTQAKLADMTTSYTAAYLMALHIGRTADEGAATPTMVSMGKLNSTRTAIEIARTCRTLLGANGISGEYPVLRHANNLESVLTYEGTAEVHQLVLGRALTGLNAFG